MTVVFLSSGPHGVGVESQTPQGKCLLVSDGALFQFRNVI